MDHLVKDPTSGAVLSTNLQTLNNRRLAKRANRAKQQQNKVLEERVASLEERLAILEKMIHASQN